MHVNTCPAGGWAGKASPWAETNVTLEDVA